MKKINNKQKFYVHILQSEFDKRLAKHGNYSLRKFALEVGIEVSVISKYLRGKRIITDKSFRIISENLLLDKTSLQNKEEAFYRSLSKMKLIKKEHQDILENWHAFAILECLNLDDLDISPSIDWISKKTGLRKDIVDKVVTRLFDIGAIIEKDGKWHDAFENLTFIESEDMDNTIGRNFQKTVLDLAKSSIERNPGKEKSHTNAIMAIDERYIPEIKKKIARFRREISDFLTEKSEKKTNIYNLQINFHSILLNSKNDGESCEKNIQ